MGDFVKDHHVPVIQVQLNLRFAPGDGLSEMAAHQKEFQLFSPKHSLKSSFALINVAPPDSKDRRGFFRYLDRLKDVGSNVEGQNGHDAVIAALKDNLESKNPMPVYFTYHVATRGNIKVEVSTSTPVVFSPVKHVTISLPTLRKD
jgi:hypothetical protein